MVDYGVKSPLPIGDEVGVFPDEKYNKMYKSFVDQGKATLREALDVGIAVEQVRSEEEEELSSYYYSLPLLRDTGLSSSSSHHHHHNHHP